MRNKNTPMFSRRQFAQRAAMISATASLIPAGAILPGAEAASKNEGGHSGPALSAAGQAEADSRYQQVLSLYGGRLDPEQKANIKRMCAELQPVLERVREFRLENGNAPALYLKPLVERDKKPQPAPKPGGKKS